MHSRMNVRAIVVWLWYWLPPLVLMAVIFSLSSQPHLPQAPGELLDALLKKLTHAAVYTTLFLLLFRAWRHSGVAHRAPDAAMLATAMYALSDELHQSLVPGRKANWYDVLIDVIVPLLLWWLCRRGQPVPFLRRQDEYVAE